VPLKYKKLQQSRRSGKDIPVDFEIEDFVLHATPINNIPKLTHKRCGPYRVTDSKSELVFEICEL
jgi:hypothetical protein